MHTKLYFRSFLLIISLFITSASFASNIISTSKIGTDSSNYYYSLGYNLYIKGDYKNAVVNFTKSIVYNKKNILALTCRGWSYIYLMEFKKAMEDGNTIINYDSIYIADAYGIRGTSKSGLGQNKEAILDLNEYIKRKPKDAVGYQLRADAYRELHDGTRAIEDYTSAIQFSTLKPEMTELYCRRGDVYLELNKLNEAYYDYEKASQLLPDLNTPYRKMAIVCNRKGEYEAALKNINRAINLKLDKEDLYTKLTILFDQGNFEDCLQGCNLYMQLDPSNAQVYILAGMCYYRTGSYSNALWNLLRAEKKGGISQSYLIYDYKGKVYSELKDYSSAEIEFTKLIKEQPSNGNAYLSRAQVRMELRKYKEVITDCKTGIDLIKDKTTIHDTYTMLSMAYLLTGNFDESLNVLNTVPLTDNESKKLIFLLKATTFIGKMDYEKALNECNGYLSLDASNPIMLKYRGTLNLVMQNYSSAIDDFVKVAEMVPNIPDAYTVLNTDFPLGTAINDVSTKTNKLVLFKDTSTNTVNVAFIADKLQKEKILNELTSLFNQKIEKSAKKRISYLLMAEFNKALSSNSNATLEYYNKAITVDPNSGAGFYLRGKFQKDYMKKREEGCKDIMKARSLGIETRECTNK